MAGEKGLAQSIKYRAEHYLNSMGIDRIPPVMIDGVGVDYPYSEVEGAGYNEPIPEGVWKNYEALKSLHTSENIPPHWKTFIKEVNKSRKANGCYGPVDLVYGLFFFTEEHPLAQKANLPHFALTDDGVTNFQDTAIITNTINTILANDELRHGYQQVMDNLLPDLSQIPLGKDYVQKMLSRMGITGGVVLDLGCGIGRDTAEWSEKLGLFTLGLERQYHPQW